MGCGYTGHSGTDRQTGWAVGIGHSGTEINRVRLAISGTEINRVGCGHTGHFGTDR